MLCSRWTQITLILNDSLGRISLLSYGLWNVYGSNRRLLSRDYPINYLSVGMSVTRTTVSKLIHTHDMCSEYLDLVRSNDL